MYSPINVNYFALLSFLRSFRVVFPTCPAQQPPTEQYIHKGQFNELDTEWYNSSPTALLREKRVMAKLFVDVFIICSTVQIDSSSNIRLIGL